MREALLFIPFLQQVRMKTKSNDLPFIHGPFEGRFTTIYNALLDAIPTPPPPLAEPHASFQGSINIAQEEAMDRDQADMVSIIESFL